MENVENRLFRPGWWIAAAWIVAAILLGTGCSRSFLPLNESQKRQRAIDRVEEGYSYQRTGEYQRAIAIYQDALAMSATPRVHYLLGHCYVETGDLGRAEESLSRAVAMQPNYEEARYELERVQALRAKEPGAQGAGETLANLTTITSRTQFLFDDGTDRPAETLEGVWPLPLPDPPALLATAQARKTAAPTTQTLALQKTEAPAPAPEPAAESEKPPTRAERREATQSARPILELIEPAQASTASAEPTAMPKPSPILTAEAAPKPKAEATPETPTYEEVQEAIFPDRQERTESDAEAQAPALAAASKPPILTVAHHLEKARGFLEIKEYSRALSEFDQAAELDKNNLDALLGKGDCYALQNDKDKALEEYRRATKIDERSPKPYLKIGNLYIADSSAGSQKKAADAFRQAVAIDPKCKEGFNNLGVIAMQAEQVDEAAGHFERAVEIDKSFAEALLNLGILNEMHLKKNERALHYYTTYVELGGPRSAEVKDWIADLKKN